MGNVALLRGPVSMDADELSLELVGYLLARRYLIPYKGKLTLHVTEQGNYTIGKAAFSAEPISRLFCRLPMDHILHPASPELGSAIANAVQGVYELVQFGGRNGTIELYYYSDHHLLGPSGFTFFRLSREGFLCLCKMLAMDAGYGADVRIA